LSDENRFPVFEEGSVVRTEKKRAETDRFPAHGSNITLSGLFGDFSAVLRYPKLCFGHSLQQFMGRLADAGPKRRRRPMDTRFFGTNLIALTEVKGPRRLAKPAAEDAYYEEYAPRNGRFFRIAAVVTAAWFGLAASRSLSYCCARHFGEGPEKKYLDLEF
jgi:hypothetical protein